VGPPRAQVEAQLEALLASESLAGARRSRDFLRFIVGEALAGHEDRLGGYTIGVEVFGRRSGFDPQTDPIVRVEAGRLRQRLERYYLTEGTDDPVVIEIPKGGYVPRFSYRPAAGAEIEVPAEASLAAGARAHRGRWRRAAIGTVGLLLLGALGLGLWPLLRPESAPETSATPAPARATARVAAILPFEYAADADPHPFLDTGLAEELIAAVAALPGIEVVALGSAKRAANDGLTPTEIAESLQVDYVIRGAILQERERVHVTASVIDAPSARVLESRRYEGSLDGVLDLQAQIAWDIARSMAVKVTPAFNRRLSATGERDSEVLALYHQATALRDPPSDPARSQLAEQAYRRVIELDPDFAGGYAGLAYVLAFRSWWGLSEQPETDARGALDTARLAVEKEPASGWAQVSLSFALNVTGDHDGSLSAARRAPLLSASDPYVLAFSGIFQAFAGEVDAGIPLARSAVRLDPLSVRTPFRNLAGVILFHAGRFEEAREILDENLRLGGPDGPHMACYRAATLAHLGRTEEARRELEKAETFPYEFDIRDFLGAFRAPQEADELLDALRSLGVDPEVSPAFEGQHSEGEARAGSPLAHHFLGSRSRLRDLRGKPFAPAGVGAKEPASRPAETRVPYEGGPENGVKKSCYPFAALRPGGPLRYVVTARLVV
jgi:TolB-like protein/tetratricopeptide (TPR) repeat protein